MAPSEDVLRGLLAAAPDALLAVDEAGEIVFVNDQAERVFGWPRADLLGQPVECLVPERFASHHPGMRAGYIRRNRSSPMNGRSASRVHTLRTAHWSCMQASAPIWANRG